MMIFCCPACGSALEREDRALRCANGHSYDIARQGYVHLLPVKQMHAKIPGDTKQMVDARRFTPEEIDVWDVYFTMSKTHAYILMQAGVPAEKIYVPHYIDDPYGGDLNTYRKCRDKICEELQTFEQHLGF